MKEKLEELNENYLEAVTALAKVIRLEWIIPICNKHGLEFCSGNGHWSFGRGKKMFDCVENSPKYLHKVIELLQLPTLHPRLDGYIL